MYNNGKTIKIWTQMNKSNKLIKSQFFILWNF